MTVAKTRFLLILAFGLWMAIGIAFADPIITVPCVGGNVVQNPDGSVTFTNCHITGGGTMSGSDHVVQGPGFVTLIASPLTLIGPTASASVEVGEVDYNFAPGPGTLTAACSGSLDTNPAGGGGAATGGETIVCFAQATTFSSSPAVT